MPELRPRPANKRRGRGGRGARGARGVRAVRRHNLNNLPTQIQTLVMTLKTGLVKKLQDVIDRASLSALEARTSALEARTNAAEARADALEARTDALEARTDALEAKIELLQQRLMPTCCICRDGNSNQHKISVHSSCV